MQESDLIQFLTGLLKHLAPTLVPLVPLTAPMLKFAMDLVKLGVRSTGIQFQGNVIQLVTFIVALVVTLIQGHTTGVFQDGTNWVECLGLLLVASINAAGATWVDQLFTNTNREQPDPATPAAEGAMGEDARAQLHALRQKLEADGQKPPSAG